MSDEKAPEGKQDHQAPPGTDTEGRWPGPEGPVEYTAHAHWLVLRRKEKPAAEMFSVSYLAAGAKPERPVTFLFNGGPGASSAFLHLGAVGPRRVAFPADGSLPSMPPRLVDNEASWLAFSDLVFVDPVGTGFSRIVEQKEKKEENGAEKGDASKPGDPKEYFGQKRDLESLCEFAGRWLSKHDRWGSPVFVAGESYGGYRVGRLVRMLQEDAGIGLNGAVLISPALEVATLFGNDYDIGGWVDRVPTMAAAALHHGRSRAASGRSTRTRRRTPELDAVLAEAEDFASGDYARFLARGAAMPDGERSAILTRLSDLTGLPVEIVFRCEGRVPIDTFARELLRDERKIVGLYDSTITATDPFPDRPSGSGPDPTLAGITPAYTMGVNRLLRVELGVDTDREYTLLSMEVNHAWKNDADHHAFDASIPGATDDFRYGLALNPHLRAFITHGRHDLVTPFYTSDRLRNLMRLDPATAGRLTVRHFHGGHMFYAWEASRQQFTTAIAEFIATSLPEVASR
ncbi:MAG TPA: peptidase S10 [Acidimicrobiia bacterium]|jgi:carboxypeptidase C (cathepsin A)|nr:peptidase S10 [Acidimicrobiia bacterium]